MHWLRRSRPAVPSAVNVPKPIALPNPLLPIWRVLCATTSARLCPICMCWCCASKPSTSKPFCSRCMMPVRPTLHSSLVLLPQLTYCMCCVHVPLQILRALVRGWCSSLTLRACLGSTHRLRPALGRDANLGLASSSRRCCAFVRRNLYFILKCAF